MLFHPNPEDHNKAIELAQDYISHDPLFLDTETTGLSPMDEICEIAIIDAAGQALVNTLVKPIRSIPLSATDIHGISNEMVKSAPTFRDLLPELDRILRGRTVLVYNVEFDIDKLYRSAEANGLKGAFEPWWKRFDISPGVVASHWHDVMELYAVWYGDWNDYHHSYRWQRLGAAVHQCGIEFPKNTHRAHTDAEMTRRLVLHMAQGQLTLPTNPNPEEGESNEQP